MTDVIVTYLSYPNFERQVMKPAFIDNVQDNIWSITKSSYQTYEVEEDWKSES